MSDKIGLKNSGAKVLDIYRLHFLFYETIVAFAVAFVSILLSEHIFGYEQVVNAIVLSRPSLYPLVAQISGTLLGFAITAVSIIISLTDKGIFEEFRRSNHFGDLYKIYFSTIKWLGANTALSIAGVFVSSVADLYFFFVFLFFSITSVLRLWRTIWVLINLVDIVLLKEKQKKLNQ